MSFVPPKQGADWARLVATGVNQRINGYPFPSLDAAPTDQRAGYTYYDTTLNTIRFWDGSQWNDVPALPSDPGADRILFWDDSAGEFAWLSLSNLLAISGTTLTQQHRGALVKRSADSGATNFTSPATLTWDAEVYDTDSFHDTVTDNERLTVPAGVTKVKVGAQLRFTSTVTASNTVNWTIQKNGVSNIDGTPRTHNTSGFTNPCGQIWSSVLEVEEGDYFSVSVQLQSDTSVVVDDEGTWFAIEVWGTT